MHGTATPPPATAHSYALACSAYLAGRIGLEALCAAYEGRVVFIGEKM